MESLKELLKKKLAEVEAEVAKELSTPEGRAALEKHLADFITEVQPTVAGWNPSAGAALGTAAAALNKVAAVEGAGI